MLIYLLVVMKMEIDKKLIGIRIMQKRKSAGLTQEKLAEEIGYSKNHISGVEGGKYMPTLQFIFKICTILGETPDYYLIGKITEESDEVANLIRYLTPSEQHMYSHMLKLYVHDLQVD